MGWVGKVAKLRIPGVAGRKTVTWRPPPFSSSLLPAVPRAVFLLSLGSRGRAGARRGAGGP
eukprot:6012249-Prorocentrum_lima.AAC.1